MTTLSEFYKSIDITNFEGYSQQCEKESDFLRNIVDDDSILEVMEIGFNAGHSSELFLSSNKNANVVSFDIGRHRYVKHGKSFIDKHYPNRHELIIGDSLISVPEYCKKRENKTFDLIFIDGGHTYPVAKGDIFNCKSLAHEKTIVVMDDTMNTKEWINRWNRGPNRAWNEAKQNNIIREIGNEDFSRTHGLSWGYYILD